MNVLTVLLIAASAILGSVLNVDSQCLGNDSRAIPLYASQQAFSLNLLNKVVAEAPQQSVFFSPHSIYHALLLAYFSSANQTEEALKVTLKLNKDTKKSQVLTSYRSNQYMLGLKENQSYEFSTADRLYVAKSLPISSCLEDIFDDNIVHLDFRANPALALNEINTWVSNETKGEIKDLLTSQSITQATDLVLVNAAYFKGDWHSQFDEESTQRAVFHISSKQQTFVDMMYQQGTFRYLVAESLGATVLEMPYNGDDISMVLMLPPFSSPTGLDDLLAKLSEAELALVLSEDEGMERLVDVRIPKFKVEKTIELKSVLEQMGVGDLFQSTADLSGLVPQGSVHLDDAVHKAKISVDEKGTVAAAATALFSFRSSRPVDPVEFTCNYPFVYMLYERNQKSILFMGLFRGPNN